MDVALTDTATIPAPAAVEMSPWRAALNGAGAVVLILIVACVLSAAGFRIWGARMFPDIPNVAHAGGAVDGFTYVNGLAAFDEAYARGFRRFEVDFRRTHDGVIVCGHDWSAFGNKPPEYVDFLLARAKMKYPVCDLAEVIGWFWSHPSAKLISDAKEDVTTINTRLRIGLPDQLIPQVFSIKDALRMGGNGRFPIILALYKLDNIFERYAFVTSIYGQKINVAGIAMEEFDASGGLGLWAKWLLKAPVYAYTVNSCGVEESLNWFGVDAVYTDVLGAHDCVPGG